MSGTPHRITSTSTDGLIETAGLITCKLVNVGLASAAATLKLHDCATEAAAASGNQKFTIPLDTPGTVIIDSTFYAGLVAIVSGNCDVTVVTE